MHPLRVSDAIDGPASDASLRRCLRQLARRGARLVATDAGASIEASRDGRPVAIAWIDADRLAKLRAAGWVSPAGDGGEVLSKAGRDALRGMIAGPSPAEAGASASPPERRPAAPPQTVEPATGTLGWLRARRGKTGEPLLSDAAFTAGERLRGDFQRAAMMPRTTTDWEAIPRSKDELRGRSAAARDVAGGAGAAEERVRRALASVPPELAGLLLDVCCFERGLQASEKANGFPQRAGHYLLGIALNALARHYGLLPPADSGWQPRSRTLHWGAEGYRPTMDGS